jgi:uncharacterized sporulation protein YeaH/YhbH (DUF444 family)
VTRFTTTPPPPAEPLGLGDVTEADIRRTCRGTLGHNAAMVRKRQVDAAAKELVRLEAEFAVPLTEIRRLREWLKRKKREEPSE